MTTQFVLPEAVEFVSTIRGNAELDSRMGKVFQGLVEANPDDPEVLNRFMDWAKQVATEFERRICPASLEELAHRDQFKKRLDQLHDEVRVVARELAVTATTTEEREHYENLILSTTDFKEGCMELELIKEILFQRDLPYRVACVCGQLMAEFVGQGTRYDN
jgi:hypothetical protein